jgi:GTP diphosphokinase / guanosine-3',5'-bis(diphosphate) 3'-diphosphatase
MIRLADILERVRVYNPNADVELINRAYVFTAKAHAGAVRLSGEPYLVHPLEVAGILSDLRMDPATIVTGLLHDTIEDTRVTREELEKLFGEEVAFLVDSLTKISRLQFQSRADQEAENLRRMLIAMAKDIRVLIVKLADRLHNMRTLEHLPPDRQAAIAQETLDIYAPLANRLGMSKIKAELEDLSFRTLKPEAYGSVHDKVTARRKESEGYIQKVIDILHKAMAEHGIAGADITGRTKHLYGIWSKMAEQNLEFEQIYDLVAFRVVVDDLRQCYEVLGVLHSIFKPIPGRFKDYIGFPKSNHYQSLHTTVIGPVGEQMEVQIRTREMHLMAEDGIAAHWKYKEGARALPAGEIKRFTWFKKMLEDLQEVKDAREMVDSVRQDLLPDEVYVFTPKGDVKVLPSGSTPVDFAYGIHSDVGDMCVGAKINGKMVPLKYKLKNGDIVAITTSKGHRPSKDWLKSVVTNRAKSKIRAFVKAEEREQSIKLGEELLERELKKIGTTLKKLEKEHGLEKAATAFGFGKGEEVLAAIGYGKYSARLVLGRLFPGEEIEKRLGGGEDKALEVKAPRKAAHEGIVIDGIGDLMVRFAKCCNPLPGDDVVGIITRGRGISVHAADCPNARPTGIDHERMVPISWDRKAKVARQARIRVVSEDKRGLLTETSAVITARNINIINADIRTTGDNKAVNTFELQVEDADQLRQLLHAIAAIKGVISVERLKSGSG